MLEILNGDCRELLKTLPDESVHTCVTSPPYWGLRDYGTAKWDGGLSNCDHAQLLGGTGPTSQKQVTSKGTQIYFYKGQCKKCGALRIDNQIGQEETPEEFVESLVNIFREVRRVLRKDGTLWLNLGDSYAGGGVAGSEKAFKGKQGSNRGALNMIGRATIPVGLKSKDLVGIPWRVALALQADGWFLRSDIIWAKPNPMPESITDRPTKSHEYIFLLSKSERYFYDHEAIKEPVTEEYRTKGRIRPTANNKAGFEIRGGLHKVAAGSETRNKRSVWTVTTKGVKDAHFATYPPELIRPCILAGSPVGGTVLDPFGGSGTTGKVALELGRKSVLIELNPEYIDIIDRRTQTTLGLPLVYERDDVSGAEMVQASEN